MSMSIIKCVLWVDSIETQTREANQIQTDTIAYLTRHVERKPRDVRSYIGCGRYGLCPVCGCDVEYTDNYCSHCGQRITWEDAQTRPEGGDG